MANLYAKVDFSDVERLQQRLQEQGSGPLREALRTVGLVYLSEMQDRWLELARGGGGWKPLSEKTVDKRRKRKKYKWGLRSILFETGTLFNALNPIWSASVPGGLRQDTPYGVKVGFANNASHILPPHIMLGELARIQQQTRPILVAPSQRFVMRATEILEQASQRMIQP